MKTTADNHAIRISVVEPSGQLYGSELALLDILEEINHTKFQFEVILPQNAPFETCLRKAQIQALGLLPAQLQHRPRWRKTWSYLRLTWHWRQRRPDLVYVNQGGILRPVTAIARNLQLPIICQVQTVEDSNWVSTLPHCHEQVLAFICNSRYVSATTQVPPKRLCTIYQGYKHKRLAGCHRQDFDFSRPLRVGLLGRICESKGHHVLVESAGYLKKFAPGQFQFRLIGDALNPQELSAVQTRISQLGVGSMIEFRGYRSNIAAELAELDVLAIPSIAEPFGRILCESAEAGVPVVVADSGGLGELSRQFGVGVQFKGGNSEDLARQLQSIRSDYLSISDAFKTSAQRLLTSLNLSDYVKTMEELLIEAAGGKSVSLEWLGGAMENEVLSVSASK